MLAAQEEQRGGHGGHRRRSRRSRGCGRCTGAECAMVLVQEVTLSRWDPRPFVDEEVAFSALGSEVAFAHRSCSFRYFSATSLCRRVGLPTFTIAVGNRSVAAPG